MRRPSRIHTQTITANRASSIRSISSSPAWIVGNGPRKETAITTRRVSGVTTTSVATVRRRTPPTRTQYVRRPRDERPAIRCHLGCRPFDEILRQREERCEVANHEDKQQPEEREGARDLIVEPGSFRRLGGKPELLAHGLIGLVWEAPKRPGRTAWIGHRQACSHFQDPLADERRRHADVPPAALLVPCRPVQHLADRPIQSFLEIDRVPGYGRVHHPIRGRGRP